MKIYWYCPSGVVKDFKDSLDNPSFRLRCWYNHINLIKEGYSSFIVDSTSKIWDPDVIILMSFGEEELFIAEWMKNHNKKIIHDYTENIRGIPVLEKTKQLCDFIVCSSTELAKKESEVYKTKVLTIKDPVEDFPIKHNPDYAPDKLSVVWSGMGGNASWITQTLKPIVESVGMNFVEISNREEATLQWDRKKWYTQMAECDISICPQVHWYHPCKSNVKVTTAMSLNLPILASPITSYLELINNGENGYICNTFDDWSNYLENLKDIKLRKLFIKNYEKSLNPYKIKNIYNQWKYLFKTVN